MVSGGGGGEWQTRFNVSPGPGLWSLVLGPYVPDLGPDLDLVLLISSMKPGKKKPFFVNYVVHLLICGCKVNCSVTVSEFKATYLVYKYQMLSMER